MPAEDRGIRTDADEETSPVTQRLNCAHRTTATGPVVVEIAHLSCVKEQSETLDSLDTGCE